jgi:hypothetical protein
MSATYAFVFNGAGDWKKSLDIAKLTAPFAKLYRAKMAN